MIRQIGLALLLLFSLSACSTMQHAPDPRSASEGGVRVLYRYPPASYTTLGTYDFDYYFQPGSHEPSFTDVLPSLKAKALSVGGNALIVRDHGTCWGNKWCTSISAEVLSVDWSAQASVRP